MIRKVKSYLIKKFPKFMQKKLVLLYGVIILALLFLWEGNLYQCRSGDEYTRVVLEQQQYDSQTIPYKRGDITDRRDKACNE